MRRKRNSIIIVLILLICFSLKTDCVLADEENMNLEPRILIVIDKSGSLKEEEESVRQALEMLYAFLESQDKTDMIDVLVFANDVAFTEMNKWESVEVDDDYTNVSTALERANQWVEERKQLNERGYVVVISDLLSDARGEYTSEEAEEEQTRVDTVIETWKECEKAGFLDYLFITWRSDAEKELKEYLNSEEQKIDKFYCSISDKTKIHYLEATGKSEDGKAVSNVLMTGEMLKKLMEGVTDARIKEQKYFDNKKNIEISDCYEVYILADKDCSLSLEESSLCSTDDMQLFHLQMCLEENEIKINRVGDEKYIYCLYFPVKSKPPRILPVDKMVGQDVTITYTVDDAYQRSKLQDPLKICIYKGTYKDNVLVCEVELNLEEDGVYQYKKAFEEPGKFFCEIRMQNDYILETSNVFTVEGESIFPSICVDDEEQGRKDSVYIIVVCIVVVALSCLALGRNKTR